MMKKICLLSAAIALAGCSANPIPMASMQPSPVVYGQLQKEFFLKEKIALDTVQLHLPPKPLNKNFYNEIYANSNAAFASALDQAGLLAKNADTAPYKLTATVVDVQDPSCAFKTTCETGSSIQYELRKAKDGAVVYKELVVVPFSLDFPLFGANMPLVIQDAMGGALGNNFAHVIHVLTNLSQKEVL
jgi:hypothetical protein